VRSRSAVNARKKKSHQRMKSNSSFRYEEFALWCADILESTECAVSLTHLTAYLDRFAHDKVAHARESDATGGGGDSDDFDISGDTGGVKLRKQLQQRGSRRRRESREKLERERKKQLAASSSAAAGEVDRKEHHDVGGVAGSGDESGATADHRVVAARRMKLSSMFPVYGHLVNLRDLKRDIGADEVETLFSVLCYRPYHPATTLPSASTSPPMVRFFLCVRVRLCVRAVARVRSTALADASGATTVLCVDVEPAARDGGGAQEAPVGADAGPQPEHGQHEAADRGRHADADAGQGDPYAPQVVIAHPTRFAHEPARGGVGVGRQQRG
jgi:hypothetical protein